MKCLLRTFLDLSHLDDKLNLLDHVNVPRRLLLLLVLLMAIVFKVHLAEGKDSTRAPYCFLQGIYAYFFRLVHVAIVQVKHL